jgi:CubicO group peptidase (beta-lactamase class C family)
MKYLGHARGAAFVAWFAFGCASAPVAAPATAPARDAAPAPRWTIPSNDAIRALLAGRADGPGVGIVVGVIEPAGRRIVARGESGAADGRPLDGDTMFLIGSVTKVFTGLLMADMVRRGEVKLDDPAARYLPPRVRMPERGSGGESETATRVDDWSAAGPCTPRGRARCDRASRRRQSRARVAARRYARLSRGVRRDCKDPGPERAQHKSCVIAFRHARDVLLEEYVNDLP